ncbi:MAG: hypothetical protein EXR71_12835 [Myxococcales bacterium]|nr:hypothetical protein [Myxococcales bacterium]
MCFHPRRQDRPVVDPNDQDGDGWSPPEDGDDLDGDAYPGAYDPDDGLDGVVFTTTPTTNDAPLTTVARIECSEETLDFNVYAGTVGDADEDDRADFGVGIAWHGAEASALFRGSTLAGVLTPDEADRIIAGPTWHFMPGDFNGDGVDDAMLIGDDGLGIIDGSGLFP